jgi:hypothetical protein
MIAHFPHSEAIDGVPAQHGLAADGALRPQDRVDFETWNQLDGLPDL